MVSQVIKKSPKSEEKEENDACCETLDWTGYGFGWRCRNAHYVDYYVGVQQCV